MYWCIYEDKDLACFVTRHWFHEDFHPVNSRFRSSSHNVQAYTAVCQLLMLHPVPGMLQQTAGFVVHPELLLVDTWPASPPWPDLSLWGFPALRTAVSFVYCTIYSLLTLSPGVWSVQISHEGSCLCRCWIWCIYCQWSHCVQSHHRESCPFNFSQTATWSPPAASVILSDSNLHHSLSGEMRFCINKTLHA